MNCKDCKYCEYLGRGIAGGYKCTHKKIRESAKRYEKIKGKRFTKSVDHIGYNMIKTSLRHCPLKAVDERGEKYE